MNIIVDNMDDLANAAIREISTIGHFVSPRGMLIKEIIGSKIVLTNPRNRISYNPERGMKLSFAIGEFLWYISGSSDCDSINYYNTRYHNYSDDGVDLNGAYGKRIFFEDEGESQWKRVCEILKNDPDSRQAIINIFEPRDLKIVTKDVPCTNTIQYFIRNKKLECIVYMRSNDLIWGTPYDIFSFTMMQEIMSNILNVDIGNYIHMVGSLHIYESHFKLAENMYNVKDYIKYTMPPMPEDIQDDFPILIECARNLRQSIKLKRLPVSQYAKDLLSILYEYATSRYHYPYIYDNLVVLDSYKIR